MKKEIIIYGANGFTGKHFAKHLISQGIQPILAGRSDKVIAVARALDLKYRIFSIDQATEALQDVQYLVNLAGPFALTQDALIQACIATHTHYLDIAGEYDELGNAFGYHQAAKDANIVVLASRWFWCGSH